ncbi:hypothetical protein CEXT_16631 [Caerostris extrusa]|uniref:Uncharacterized protein n=1 Tax=Caerostris extrusa TaxID=172846 RepID=A0AAV4Q9N7_CAEEX|nr:hypothetical protein CEXT_16631 [Caerostris extrusa]
MLPDTQILFAPVFMALKIMCHNPFSIKENYHFNKVTCFWFLLGVYLLVAHTYRTLTFPRFFSHRVSLLLHSLLELFAYVSIAPKLKELVNMVDKMDRLRKSYPANTL